jgi:Integrase core domain
LCPGDQAHLFVIHDRDTIYSEGVDHTLEAMGLAVLKTPARVPQANTFCERLIGTIRHECLDFVIPMTERHVRAFLREWISHYNRGRPHASLGPGIPDGPLDGGISDSKRSPAPDRLSSRRDGDPQWATLRISFREKSGVKCPLHYICGSQGREQLENADGEEPDRQ